jgi:hypothetical protein
MHLAVKLDSSRQSTLHFYTIKLSFDKNVNTTFISKLSDQWRGGGTYFRSDISLFPKFNTLEVKMMLENMVKSPAIPEIITIIIVMMIMMMMMMIMIILQECSGV